MSTPIPTPIQENPELSINRLERFFIWLSGSSPIVLASCPDSEQRKHAALGGTVLIPTLFSIVTSSFLLQTLSFSLPAIVLASTIWAIIILMMDRALLSTYRKKFSILGKLGQLLLRFSIALLIALTIAHPVVLLLFSGEIDNRYEKEQKIKLSTQTEQCTQAIQSAQTLYDAKNQEVDGFDQMQPPDCESKGILSFHETAASQKIKDTIKALEEQRNNLLEKQAEQLREREKFRQIAVEEEKGLCAHGRTCRRGCGPKCQEALEQKAKVEIEANKLGKEIEKKHSLITEETNKLKEFDKNFTKDRKTQEDARRQACQRKQETWQEERKLKRETMVNHFVGLGKDLDTLKQNCTTDVNKIRQQRPDILKQTLILHEILMSEEGYEGKLTFMTFMLLFLLIDMLAVILKFASTGNYDLQVDIQETNSELANFTEKRQAAIIHFVELEALERQRINNLSNHALKQSLEQTLDKMVELFHKQDLIRVNTFFEDRMR